jgi:hypothetical protein
MLPGGRKDAPSTKGDGHEKTFRSINFCQLDQTDFSKKEDLAFVEMLGLYMKKG